MSDFLSLGLSKTFIDILQQNGVVIPTPIQERTIPIVLEGKDLIGQAQTGTGKTFAFILPILENINPHSAHVQALIVTPTRELALQITGEIKKLIMAQEEIHVLAAYGGQDVEKQLHQLKKNVHIVVGTPGRLLDHIRRETIQLSHLSYLVLDEADQMLHIGFLSEVEEIIKQTPARRQTLLFSATMPTEIRTLANQYMRTPEYIQVEKKQGPALSVKQIAFHTTDRAKQSALIQLITTYRPFLAVIFCRTKRRVSKLYEVLKANGFSCDELHGNLSQSKREQVMQRFRNAEIQLLIATDVAARGLDVEGVTHVFNYDIPQDAESYVHRIGRTGRAGMTGMAITFYSSSNRQTLEMIEKELNIRIEKQNLEKKNEQQRNNSLVIEQNRIKESNKVRHKEKKDTSKQKKRGTKIKGKTFKNEEVNRKHSNHNNT